MSITPQTLKGFRDFLPTEARKRSYVINALKKVFESYGFDPLETPVLEYEEVLLGKYGEEGDKLMYRFTDNGQRRIAMRYDQTVPLARVIAQYGSASSPQVITLPFKRYQISNVYRGENTQRGRFREFTQCDIDIVGANSALSDAEVIQVAISSLESLGIKNFKVLINDREVFRNLEGKDPGDELIPLIRAMDKLKKIGKDAVIEEMTPYVPSREDAISFFERVENAPQPQRISDILSILSDKRVVFTPTLARGLDYYTGIIIEVEIDGYDAGSVGGGGRYDNLIGMFSGQNIPAVGFAFGFDRLLEALDSMNLFKMDSSVAKTLVTVFSNELKAKSLEVSSRLRSNNINTEIWLDDDFKMEKQLKYAIRKKIPYLVVIGPDEAAKNMVTIKALDTRDQKTVTLQEAIQMIG